MLHPTCRNGSKVTHSPVISIANHLNFQDFDNSKKQILEILHVSIISIVEGQFKNQLWGKENL